MPNDSSQDGSGFERVFQRDDVRLKGKGSFGDHAFAPRSLGLLGGVPGKFGR